MWLSHLAAHYNKKTTKVSEYGLVVIMVSTSALQAESRGSIPRQSTSQIFDF